MSAPRNVNRCTPCLEGAHGRCTGSAGNVGCGCIHAAPVPQHVVTRSPDEVAALDALADLVRAVDTHLAKPVRHRGLCVDLTDSAARARRLLAEASS